MALSKAGLVDVIAITGETALAATPATTDEFLINDGGTIKRLDATHMMLSPVFAAEKSSAQTISNATTTKLTFDQEIYDPDGTWDASTNHRFTPGVAGYYLISCHGGMANLADDQFFQLHLYKNGSQINTKDMGFTVNGADTTQDTYFNFSYPIVSDADDYFEVFGRHSHGSNCNTVDDNRFHINAFKILGAGS
tara:strand:+ start:15 stop:596 length:582 start_codon:yes stop_codon:yes gene_type:complete